MSQTIKMFFQVILPEALHLDKLKIPTKFVRLYGAMCLAGGYVLLVAPNGDTWPVCVETREDGVVMFGAGWTEFARHYSIGDMYFIMFRYKCHHKSSAVFNVVILKDSTGTEITYPTRAKGPFFESSTGNNRVPIGFLEEARLCEEKTLFIQGQTGNKCPVKLNRSVRLIESKKDGVPKEYIGYSFGAGWSDFLKENEFVAGDKLFFQQIEGCLISVRKVVG